MVYTLEVTFEGLCALLPSEEIRPRQDLDWVTIFMVDSENKGHAVHEPLLRFDLSAQEGQNPAIVNKDAEVRWPLRDVDVFFEFASSDITVVRPAFGNARGERPDPQIPEEVTDLFWVPRLDKTLPYQEASRRGLTVSGSDMVHDCLLAYPQSDRVVARIHLRRGLLRTLNHVKVNDRISVSQFLPTEEVNPLRQALSAGIALVVRSVEGPVQVRIRPFGGQFLEKVVLGSAQRTDLLKVRFTNLCADRNCEYPSGSSRDEDLELFYLLNGVKSQMDIRSFDRRISL